MYDEIIFFVGAVIGFAVGTIAGVFVVCQLNYIFEVSDRSPIIKYTVENGRPYKLTFTKEQVR